MSRGGTGETVKHFRGIPLDEGIFAREPSFECVRGALNPLRDEENPLVAALFKLLELLARTSDARTKPLGCDVIFLV